MCGQKNIRRAGAASGHQFWRLPNGEVNGFGQVLGEVKRLALHGSTISERRGDGHICGRKCCGSVAGCTATGTMATAVVVIARTVGVGVLMPGIIGARSLRFAFGTAGLFGGFLVKLLRVLSIVAATSPSAVRR